MRVLVPVKIHPHEFDPIEQYLVDFFRREIYIPLMSELGLPKASLHNTIEDLIDAISKGRVRFHRGSFTGRFNSKLSRELRKLGAHFKDGEWKIASRDLPNDVLEAISSSEARFESVLEKIDRRLSEFLPEQIAERISLTKLFDRVIYTVDGRTRASLKAIGVPPRLTEARAAKIAEDYSQNMKLSIKDWTENEIKVLRKQMLAYTFKGYRYEGIVKTIQRSYRVSQRKAKFLARQETNLLLCKFKESRYAEAGVTKYKWKCVIGSPLHPVRPLHQKLNDESEAGKIFQFADPPIDSPDGSRHNPGENYNCRCVALPIVQF